MDLAILSSKNSASNAPLSVRPQIKQKNHDLLILAIASTQSESRVKAESIAKVYFPDSYMPIT